MVWGRCLNIKDVCIDSESCFKIHNLVSDYPKSIKFGQITTHTPSLSLGYNLKLAALFSYPISEWPVSFSMIFT